MPAPVPIQFHYDDAGVLARAAMALGRAQGQQQQQAYAPRVYIRPELSQGVQYQQSLRQQLDAVKEAQQARLTGAPTVGATRRTRDDAFATGIQTGRLVTGGVPASQNQTPLLAAKQAFLKNFVAATNLPEAERQALETMIPIEDVSLTQLRTAASEAARRAQQQSGTVSPSRATELQIQEVNYQRSQLSSRANQLRKRLEEQGFDPEGTVDQFASEQVENRFDFGTGLRDRTAPVVDEAGLRTLQEYRALLAKIQQLEQQRQGVISGSQPAAGQQTQPAQNSDPLGIL